MYCLHCGDCCRRLSPLSDGPCPHIREEGDFVFCGIYDRRPTQCANHDYPFRFCLIGVRDLKLTSADQVRQRIDQGWEKTRQGVTP